jgi:hypothetical protein
MNFILKFVTFLLPILYFSQRVNSLHIQFEILDANIIIIYPIYLLNYNMLSNYNINYTNDSLTSAPPIYL